MKALTSQMECDPILRPMSFWEQMDCGTISPASTSYVGAVAS